MEKSGVGRLMLGVQNVEILQFSAAQRIGGFFGRYLVDVTIKCKIGVQKSCRSYIVATSVALFLTDEVYARHPLLQFNFSLLESALEYPPKCSGNSHMPTA